MRSDTRLRAMPAVGLELRLARAARADAPAEALEVLPHPAHPRQVVLELCELDLELALGADRVLGEDVEDQLRAVDDACLEGVLEQPLLCRLELVVDDQHVGRRRAERALQLVELAFADVRARVGTGSVLHDLVHRLDSGRPGQLAQLGELVRLTPGRQHGDRRARARALRRAQDRAGGRHRWIMPPGGRTASVRPVHLSPVLAAQATYPFVRIEQAKRAAAATASRSSTSARATRASRRTL